MSLTEQDKENSFKKQVFNFFNKSQSLSKAKSLLIPDLSKEEHGTTELSYTRGFSKSIFDKALWSKPQEENHISDNEGKFEPPKLR